MIIDILFAIAVVLACIRGFRKGLVIGVFSLVALLAGIVVAIKFSAAVAVYLQGNTSLTARWAPVISFLLLFIAIVLLVRLGAKLLEKALEFALLGWANRIGGMLFFSLLYLLTLSTLLFYADKLEAVGEKEKKESVTYPYLQKVAPFIIHQAGKVIPPVKASLAELSSFFDGFNNKKQQ